MSVTEKAEYHEVYPHSTSEYSYVVESATSGKLYKVAMVFDDWRCSCPWGETNPAKHACSHVIAVRNYVSKKMDRRRAGKPEVTKQLSHSVQVAPDGTITVTYNL